MCYGIPDEAITTALAPYGVGIKSIKSVVHENIHTGEHNVLMKITANIPAPLGIAGHWCVITYRGQKPVCFKCHKEGHVIADCPTYQNNQSQKPEQEISINKKKTNFHNATHSSSNNNNTDLSVTVAPSLPLVYYAAVAGSNLSTLTPSKSADESSTLSNSNNTQPAPNCASGAPVFFAPSGGWVSLLIFFQHNF